jgi:hypothetical protein
VVSATSKTFSGRTVAVTFQNDTATGQVLDGLGSNGGVPVSWPQTTNGNLIKITMGSTTIYNTATASPLSTNSLSGTAAQRTIAAGSCAVVTFTFKNNVSINPGDYMGTAHFNTFGNVQMFP